MADGQPGKVRFVVRKDMVSQERLGLWLERIWQYRTG